MEDCGGVCKKASKRPRPAASVVWRAVETGRDKMRFGDFSLRRKLIAIITLTSTAALLLACTALITYSWITSKEEMRQDAETLAEIIEIRETLFANELHQLARELKADKTACEAMKSIIQTEKTHDLDALSRLQKAGLVLPLSPRNERRYRCRCGLFHDYLKRVL